MTEKNLKVDVFASTHTGLAFLREFSLKGKKKILESYIEQLKGALHYAHYLSYSLEVPATHAYEGH